MRIGNSSEWVAFRCPLLTKLTPCSATRSRARRSARWSHWGDRGPAASPPPAQMIAPAINSAGDITVANAIVG